MPKSSMMKALKTFYDQVLEEGTQTKRTLRAGHEFEPLSTAHGRRLEEKGLAVWVGKAPDGDEGAETASHGSRATAAEGGTSREAPRVAPLRPAGGKTGGTPVSSSSLRADPARKTPPSASSKAARTSK